MKILVVEDNDARIARFSQELVGHQIDFATDATSGIDLVKRKQYDIIFLDHDLGGQQMVDSDYWNTGYQVAKAIVGTNNEDAYIVIHSANPGGAERMKGILPKAIKVPFCFLNIRACVETNEEE